MTAFFTFLADQPIVFVFLLIGVGMVFGQIKIKGVGLGAAAVLFFAIGLSAWADALGVNVEIPVVVGHLGLAVFAFAIGVNSGAAFFHNLKTALGPIVGMILTFIAAGGVTWAVGKYVFKMDSALIGGTFAGSITNTPALSAASESSGNEALATTGYAIAYVFGVIGMMIVAFAALQYGKRDTDAPSPLANRTVRIQRQDGPTVGDIYEKMGGKVTFSRLRRGESGPITRPAMSDTLDENDLITVVGPRELVTEVANELGHSSSHSLMKDRTYLDFRRITVSDPALAGRTVGELEMSSKFSATVSRVRRGDIDMVGEPGLVLQVGDRVRVVAPTSKMDAVTKFFGDSARGLSDINPIALGIGIALGAAIGAIPIPTGGGSSFHIGAAAGALIVGLIFGKIGRIGPLVTAVPFTACQVLIELGLLLFLAQAGVTAGGMVLKAFSGGEWWQILVLGIITTSFVGLSLYTIMRWIFRMGGTQLAGLLGGAQTQPAVLVFANNRTGADPRVALGYSLVYPVAMITKILVALVLGGLG